MNSLGDIQNTITQLSEAGASVDFEVDTFGHAEGYPLLGMTRPADKSITSESKSYIYLSAGIHGDEPAGPQALLELLEADALPRTHHYVISPLLNPVGLSHGTRENGEGIDLNRDYRDFVSCEISAHQAWIEQKVQSVTCAIHLHEDWESQGFYLYEHNPTRHPGFSDQIMHAVRQHLPIETAEIIEGRIAINGIIRPAPLPELEEGDPESIYLQKRYAGLNYTLETPSAQDFRLRVEALKAAVLAVL